jgi:hypothetical protein
MYAVMIEVLYRIQWVGFEVMPSRDVLASNLCRETDYPD